MPKRPLNNKRKGKESKSNVEKNILSKGKESFSTKWDEEIESEDDDEIESNNEDNIQSEDEEIDETAEQKRRRMAKEYLAATIQEIQNNDSEADSDDLDELLPAKLRKERLKSQGKYYRNLSESFERINLRDLTPSTFQKQKQSFTCIAMSNDETKILSGSKDNSVVLWDTETGAKTYFKSAWREKDGKKCHEGEVLAVAVSSDGRFAASGGRDKLVRIYDLRAGSLSTEMKGSFEVKSLPGHRDAVTGLSFRRDSLSLFSTSLDRCMKMWDVEEKAYMETMFGHQDCVNAVDCGGKLKPVTASSDRTVRVWKVEEEKHNVFRGPRSSVDCVRLLTEDSFLSGGQEGNLQLWRETQKKPISLMQAAHGWEGDEKKREEKNENIELEQEQEGGTIERKGEGEAEREGRNTSGIPRWITSLACVPMSDLAASGSSDGFIRMWQANGGGESGTKGLRSVGEMPMKGFVNGLVLTPRLLVAAVGQEHRLGRWWKIKEAQNQISIFRFPENLQEI